MIIVLVNLRRFEHERCVCGHAHPTRRLMTGIQRPPLTGKEVTGSTTPQLSEMRVLVAVTKGKFRAFCQKSVIELYATS